MSIHNLHKLFSASSIAVVGASPRPASVGYRITRNLTDGSFSGQVWLVNPAHDAIDGKPCYRSLSSLPGTPDIAVIATPPGQVLQTVQELARMATSLAIIITAGIMPADHAALTAAARAAGMRLIGSNCLGAMAPAIGLNASFSHIAPIAGDLAFVSQSGALITAVLDWASTRSIGFSCVVSLGDMADVNLGDLLDYLAGDIHTRAILLYVEAVRNAREFMSAARLAARAKPVVVIKSGRHAEGARAAASHTGALAGSDAVYDAAFFRAGLLRVHDLDELFAAAETLSRLRPFEGDRLAILTNGGGAGVLAVDQLIDEGGTAAILGPQARARLDAVLPANWSKRNPVDIIGDAGPQRYRAAMEILLEDKSCDALLVMNCPTALSSSSAVAKSVIEAVETARGARWPSKPVLANWLGDPAAREARALFAAAKIPSYATPTDAIRGFMHMARYSRAQTALLETPVASPQAPPDLQHVRAIIDGALGAGRTLLNEMEAKAVLEAYHIPVVETLQAATAKEVGEQALRLAERGGAVAVKIVSPDITHKSDIGGVALNLATPQAAQRAAGRMLGSVSRLAPGARVVGFTVQPMIERKGALELIAGISTDQTFGPVVLFGAGGTAVEVIDDKVLGLPPLNRPLARTMVERTRIWRLLQGYRDQPAADSDAIADTLVRLSQLAADVPEIRELDINPLLADMHGVIALDARLKVAAFDRARRRHGDHLAIRPYPGEWETTLHTPQGLVVFVRPVKAEDEHLYDTFFARLDPHDVRLRLFRPVKQLSHRFIARLTQIDYARAMAFVALDESCGELLGVARLNADADYRRAEYAIIVRSDLKGQGLGWALMEHLIAYARVEGLEELYGDVLNENRTMLTMCAEMGFAQDITGDDPSLVRVTLPLRRTDA